MEARQLMQLRAYEKMLIARILDDYGIFLSEEKKRILAEKSLIPDDFEQTFTSKENLQGEIVRLVFRKVFEHIECTKNMVFSDGTNPKIPYGEYLNLGLVVYFSKELSQKYGLSIDDLPELNSNLELILKMKELLQDNFSPLVFGSDAISILNAANNPEFTKICDSDAVKKYIVNLNKADNKDNEKEVVESITGEGKVFPPIYANGVQYIKYIDEHGQVHMIKSINPHLVSTAYREMITSLSGGKKINAREFFESLRKHGENIPIHNELDIQKSRLSHEESDMLNTIYSDKELMQKAGGMTIEHSSDMNVHIVGDDVAITDKNETGTITTQSFDGNQSVEPSLHPEESSELRLITTDEYVELCMRTVNGKPLTEQEYQLMEYYDRHYYKDENPAQVTPEAAQKRTEKYQEGPTLKLDPSKSYKNPSGFAQKFLPVFIVILTVLIGIIVGIAVFKIKQVF